MVPVSRGHRGPLNGQGRLVHLPIPWEGTQWHVVGFRQERGRVADRERAGHWGRRRTEGVTV